MWNRYLLIVSSVLVLTGGLAGCDKLPFGSTSTSDMDDEFAEFDDFGDAPSKSEPAEIVPVSHTDAMEYTADPSELSLQLTVGARFPLIKTVEQRLTQQLPTGPVAGHSRLELRLSLTVEEQREANRRIGVRYHRVRYSQDLGGEQVQYDSDAPPTIVHPAALVYAGLKDNAFSFWLGPDNRVLELVGFSDFLRRCVANVPLDQRTVVLQQLAAMRSEDGLASFVDDSIGLLPNPTDPQLAGQPLRVGSGWDLRPQTGSAVSGGTSTRCLLKSLNPDTAEIALVGTIGPSNYVDDVRQLKLTVRGGQCSGTCIVDRQTGMPTQSRIDRYVDMIAQLPDGTEIPQRKEVVTTVVAFLDQGTPSQAVAPATFETTSAR